MQLTAIFNRNHIKTKLTEVAGGYVSYAFGCSNPQVQETQLHGINENKDLVHNYE